MRGPGLPGLLPQVPVVAVTVGKAALLHTSSSEQTGQFEVFQTVWERRGRA